MSLEALLFQVLCILAVFAITMCVIEHTRNKKPTQRCNAEQATRNTPTSITK